MAHYASVIEHAPRPGSALFYALVFTPRARRASSRALYALCRELDEARDCRDEGVARIKLHWWHEELQRTAIGAPRHPIAQSLASQAPAPIPAMLLADLVAGREMALAANGPADRHQLFTYADRGAGSALRLWAYLLAGDGTVIDHLPAKRLAFGLELVRILDAVYSDALRGRSLLPCDKLTANGIGVPDLAVERAPSEAIRNLLSDCAADAIDALGEALEQWPQGERLPLLPLLILGEIRLRTLQARALEGFHAPQRRIVLAPPRKLWTAWRRARREVKKARRSATDISR